MTETKKRGAYIKGLQTRAAKWPEKKAFEEIWLRLVASHVASPDRALQLHLEAQTIALVRSGVAKAEGKGA